MASLFTNISEVVVIIGIMIASWATASAVNRQEINKAYLFGGITAMLGFLEVILVSINCF